MADSTHYFVRHIDNSVNFNIHERASNLPTTIKVVVNLIITAGVVNNSDGAKQMCVRSSSCVPRATGHLGGGSQCACRRKM